MSQAESEVGVERIAAVLAAIIQSDDTELTLESPDPRVAGMPASDFQLKIGTEIMLVGTRTGYSCTDLTRGVEGTVAVPHASGDGVQYVVGGYVVAHPSGGSEPAPQALINLPFSITGQPVQTSVGGSLVGGDSFAGYLGNIITLAPQVFTPGAVIDAATVIASLSGLIEAAADALDISTRIFVTDTVGTNIATTEVDASLSNPVTDLSYTTDWTAATWTVSTGVDLSGAGTVLSSAAGGVYVISVMLQAQWD